MRVFKTRWFSRFSRKERLKDETLVAAVRRAEQGLIDADLGGGVVKLRVPRRGEGRSGGYRTLLAFRAKRIAVFLYGFAKSERENIDEDELTTLRELAEGWLAASDEDWDRQVHDGLAQEVDYDG